MGMNVSRGLAAYGRIMKNGGEAVKEAGEAVPDAKKKENPRLKALGEEGFLKTGQPPDLKRPPDSKYRRLAQFLVLIGSDEASKILSRLDSGQVEAISKEIVSLRSIGPEEAGAILREFHSLLSPSYKYAGSSIGGSSSGGIEEARRCLYAAFGPEKGEAMLVKAVPDAAPNPFDFLKDFSGEQLALIFRDESPAACAMVFSRLPSKLSAAVLANTTPERKLEIVRRIAHLKETSPEVIERAAAAIREKARRFGAMGLPESGDGKIDGRGVLAAILKHSDLAFGGRLLEEIEEDDPSLSRDMKDRLYTLEDICGAADRPIQEKLRSMDDREIAMLLHAGSEAFTRKILGNLSANRTNRVKEESEIMGAVPKLEREAAARDFLSWFRMNREEGRIVMQSGEDVMV